MNVQQDFGGGQKSTFVTVVAWIFIVMSGVSTLMGLAQNIMIQSILAQPEFRQAIESAQTSADAPEFVTFLFSNFGNFFLAVFLASALSLVAAVGLLLRKNWARLIFIGMMIFGILWNFAGIVLQVWVRGWMSSQMAGVPEESAAAFMVMLTTIMIIGTVFSLGFCALFGWITLRLLSPAVKREFGVV